MWSPMGMFSLEKPQLGPIVEDHRSEASYSDDEDSSSWSEDDMQNILDVAGSSSSQVIDDYISDESSVDSIIKRVEAEIENARKARRSRDENSQASSAQDMQEILAIDDDDEFMTDRVDLLEKEFGVDQKQQQVAVLPSSVIRDEMVMEEPPTPEEASTRVETYMTEEDTLVSDSVEQEKACRELSERSETAVTDDLADESMPEANLDDDVSQHHSPEELLTPIASNCQSMELGPDMSPAVASPVAALATPDESVVDGVIPPSEDRSPEHDTEVDEERENVPDILEQREKPPLSPTKWSRAKLPPKPLELTVKIPATEAVASPKKQIPETPRSTEGRAMRIIEEQMKTMAVSSPWTPRSSRNSGIPSPRTRSRLARIQSPTFLSASPAHVRMNAGQFSPSAALSPSKVNGPFGHRLRGKMFRRPERPEEVKAQEAAIRSRKIRFLDPYPVLKPPVEIKDSTDIIDRNTVPLPAMQSRYVMAKNNLKQLIVAAMGPSLHRRSHACGALKVMLQTKRNQLQLARTSFFLHALVFSAGQDIVNNEDKEIALDARNRATHCLKLVCEAKENRPLVMAHPGLVECLLKVIENDQEDARIYACEALVLLAKTPSCRSTLTLHKTIFDILARIMYPLRDLSSRKESHKMSSDMTFSTFDETNTLEPQETIESEHRDDDAAEAEAIEFTIEKVKFIQERELSFKNELFVKAQAATCALLLHLSKDCMSSEIMHFNDSLLDSLLAQAQDARSTIRTRCLEILANFSRLSTNNNTLAIYPSLIDTLMDVTKCQEREDRLWVLRCLVNLSSDHTSKRRLATDGVLGRLTALAMQENEEEKKLAVSTIYNVITDPGAVIAVTNCHNVIATLVFVSHDASSSESVQGMAREALATISLWFQTVAGSGSIPEGLPNIPLPSLKSIGWEVWHDGAKT